MSDYDGVIFFSINFVVCELSRYFLLPVYLLLFIRIDCAHSIEWRFQTKRTRTENLNGYFGGEQHTHANKMIAWCVF